MDKNSPHFANNLQKSQIFCRKQKNVAFRLVLWLDKLKKSPLIIKFQYNIMNAKTFLGSNRVNCADFSQKSTQKQLFLRKHHKKRL